MASIAAAEAAATATDRAAFVRADEIGARSLVVADAVAAPELRRDYARLTEAVTDILTATPPQDSLSLSAVRVLTLHHWRRPRRKVLRSLTRADLGAIRRICFRTHVCVF